MEYPDEVIRTLLEKHTIRRFEPVKVGCGALELIVEAGLRETRLYPVFVILSGGRRPEPKDLPRPGGGGDHSTRFARSG